MASYLITGVSRGLGFEFLDQLSRDGSNTIIGLVRNKEATEEKVKKELGSRSNVHIVQADMTDYDSLKSSVPAVEKISGGRLDYIIANAGLISMVSGLKSMGSLSNTPEVLEKDLLDCFRVNVVGNIHLFNLFLPQVLKGTAKKVITISSGHADADLIAKWDIYVSGPYSISKGAMNVAVAKYSAEYRKQGVLFLSISPGAVDTSGYSGEMNEEIEANMKDLFAKFSTYAPNWTGPTTPEVSIRDMLKVIEKSSIENGDGGAFVSQFGNKQWL